MDVYDAKQPQTCLICGFTINHNKQGWFTSHLKNEHNLTLDNYLISYFYPIEMVTCWEDEKKNDFENVKKRIINALLATT